MHEHAMRYEKLNDVWLCNGKYIDLQMREKMDMSRWDGRVRVRVTVRNVTHRPCPLIVFHKNDSHAILPRAAL